MHSHLAEPTQNISGGFWRLNYNHEWDPPDWWGCHQRRWSGRNDLITPQNLHVPHPLKMLNVNMGEMQKKPSSGMHSPFMYLLSFSVWVGCYQSNSELILFSACGRDYFVSDAGAMSPREQRHVLASSNYSCTQRIESGANNRVKGGKWEKHFR